MSETSAAVYYLIKSKGLLSDRRWTVYDALYRCGPSTIGELSKFMSDEHSGCSFDAAVRELRNIDARLCELVQKGAVREVERRYCSVTGMLVSVYGTTDSLPLPGALPKGKLALARERISELEHENAQLKAIIAVSVPKRTPF